MSQIMLNNITTKLTSALTSGGTTANVTAGTGVNFVLAANGNRIRATLVKMSGFREIAREIVDVTARSTDALTIVRAKESTTALDFAIGDVLEVRATAGLLSGINGANFLYNANFEEWQSYTGAVTTTGGYGADGWLVTSGGNTFSMTQGVVTDGTDDVFFDPSGGATAAQYFTIVDVTSVAGAANFTTFEQRAEDVRRLAGKTVTLSFWAKAASGTPLIGFNFYQNFGSGGSPSAQVSACNGQSVTLSTTWTKYNLTFTLTGISGKTLGTTKNTSFTFARFWLDAGTSYNTPSGTAGQASKIVSIGQVKIEEGNVATPFVQDSPTVNFAKCQRYYYKVYPEAASKYLTDSGYAQSTTSFIGVNKFPVTMRIAPTALAQSGTAGDYSVDRAGVATTTVCTGVPTFSSATTEAARTAFPNSGATFVNGAAGNAFTTAATTTGYLAWSARL